MTFAIPSIAGFLIVSIVIEVNRKWAFAAFFCSSIVCSFTVADKEAVLIFILFFGYYPIIKSIIESIKNKLIQFVIKFLIFNLVAVMDFFIVTNIFMVSPEIFSVFGVNFDVVIIIVGNIAFLLYDIAISAFVLKYIKLIHPRIAKLLER